MTPADPNLLFHHVLPYPLHPTYNQPRHLAAPCTLYLLGRLGHLPCLELFLPIQLLHQIVVEEPVQRYPPHEVQSGHSGEQPAVNSAGDVLCVGCACGVAYGRVERKCE